MEILGIRLRKLRIGVYIDFITQLLAFLDTLGLDILKIKAQADALKSKMAELEQVYNPVRRSLITPQLEAADERRDNAISGITRVVQGYLLHFTAEKKNAAILLDANIEANGGNIARLEWSLESTNLDNLLKDWLSKPELTNAVTLLGLTEWMDELREANKIFMELMEARNAEMGDKRIIIKLKEIKEQSIALYLLLKNKLQSQANVNEFAPPYDKAINRWNEVVDHHNQILAQKEGKRAKKNEAEKKASSTNSAGDSKPMD